MNSGKQPEETPIEDLEAQARENEITSHLMGRHGPLLCRDDLAKVLRFPTAVAFDRYCQRGFLKLELVKPPNRRGVFAHARVVARYLIDIPREVAGREREKDK